MRSLLCRCFAVSLLVTSIAQAQADIHGADFALKSSGAADGTAWKLSESGFVGTYIKVPNSGDVTVVVNALAESSTDHKPQIKLVIADAGATFDLATTAGDYTAHVNLPAGLYLAALQSPLGNKAVTFTSLRVLGAEIVNENADANALAAADTYVANFRKCEATVKLAGVGPDSKVTVKLARHAFNFGTVVPEVHSNTVLTENPAPGSDAYRYQQFIKDWFSAIVPGNAGKWASNEETRGQLTMDYVDTIIKFAKQNHLRMRMHNLIWGTQQPQWVNELLKRAQSGDADAKEELRKAVSDRIAYYVRDRAANYAEMDVLNEIRHNPPYWNVFGADGLADIYNEAERAVKDAGAHTLLYTNEYNVLQWSHELSGGGKETRDDPYANWYLHNTQDLLAARGAVQGIGVQYYADLHDNTTRICPHSPARMAGAFQNLAVSGLPLCLTEFGMQRGHDTYDPALPPKIIGETMRLVFGTPQMTGFLVWGFRMPWLWDQADAGALLDKDWNPTPAGKVFEQLMTDWRTDVTTTADADGKINFSGFYGDYDVTAGGRHYRLTLTKGTREYSIAPDVK